MRIAIGSFLVSILLAGCGGNADSEHVSGTPRIPNPDPDVATVQTDKVSSETNGDKAPAHRPLQEPSEDAPPVKVIQEPPKTYINGRFSHMTKEEIRRQVLG